MLSFFDNKERLIESLRTKNEQLENSNKLMLSEIRDYKKTINEYVDIKYEYDANLKKMAKDYSDKIFELNNQLESERKSVNRKVNLALANIGVGNSFFAEEIVPTMSSNDIKETFNRMPEGKQKHEFYEKHKNVLTQNIK
jgi:hypothetical protein